MTNPTARDSIYRRRRFEGEIMELLAHTDFRQATSSVHCASRHLPRTHIQAWSRAMSFRSTGDAIAALSAIVW
jgi:hypothetical protein